MHAVGRAQLTTARDVPRIERLDDRQRLDAVVEAVEDAAGGVVTGCRGHEHRSAHGVREPGELAPTRAREAREREDGGAEGRSPDELGTIHESSPSDEAFAVASPRVRAPSLWRTAAT